MGKIIKNFLYNGTYNLLMVVIPIITTPYLTRILGSTSLGVDSYVNSIVSLVKLFGALGINIYCNREIAYRRDDKEMMTKTYYELQTIRWTLGLLVTIGYLLVTSRVEYREFFLIQTLTLVAYFVDVTWLFIGFEDMKLPVLRNITIKLIQTICIFTLIKSPDDLTLYVLISAVGNIISAVCMYAQVGKYVGAYKRDNLNIKRHLKPVLALFLPQAATSIYVQFDRTMIGMLSERIDYVSIYDRAENLVKLPINFIRALSAAMAPRVAYEFARKNFDNIKNLLKGELRYILLLICPMMVGIAVISDTLVRWYLGAQYLESAMVMKVLCPIIFTIAMGEVLSTQLLVSVNETKGMLVAFSCGAICNLIANALLIPILNATGAAVGTVIAESVVVCVQYVYARKYIGKLDVISFLPKKVFGTAVMFAVIFAMGSLSNSLWMMIAQILVGVVVYFLVVYLLKDEELLSGLGNLKAWYSKKKNR